MSNGVTSHGNKACRCRQAEKHVFGRNSCLWLPQAGGHGCSVSMAGGGHAPIWARFSGSI